MPWQLKLKNTGTLYNNSLTLTLCRVSPPPKQINEGSLKKKMSPTSPVSQSSSFTQVNCLGVYLQATDEQAVSSLKYLFSFFGDERVGSGGEKEYAGRIVDTAFYFNNQNWKLILIRLWSRTEIVTPLTYMENPCEGKVKWRTMGFISLTYTCNIHCDACNHIIKYIYLYSNICWIGLRTNS